MSKRLNLDQVKLMYEESGAFIFARRTYDIRRPGHQDRKSVV